MSNLQKQIQNQQEQAETIDNSNNNFVAMAGTNELATTVLPITPSLQLPVNLSTTASTLPSLSTITASSSIPSKGIGINNTGLVDGGTTNHIMRLEVLQRLQQQGTAPQMTPMEPGAMTIAFGREENPEPVLGYINTAFGKVVIVENMSAEMLISEIEYTARQAYIIKNNTILAIIHNNTLVLYATRDPSSPAGTNEQLWMAAVEDVFAAGKQLGVCTAVPHPTAAINAILAGATRAANVSVPHCKPFGQASSSASNANTSGASEADIFSGVQFPITSITHNPSSHQSIPEQTCHQPSSAPTDSHLSANAAKPRWKAVEIRLARNCLWAVNGSASKLAKTLEANALARPPDIDPQLIRHLGDQHNDPAFRMTHDTAVHPGGSGSHEVQIGEEARADIFGLWQTDKSVYTSLGMLITDVKSKFSKVYALDDKTAAADGVNAYRDLMAEQGFQVMRVKFDYASEVSEEYVKRVNDHLIRIDKLRTTIPTSSTTRSQQGVEISKAPKEAYEVMVEARWRSIKKEFARALIAQHYVPQQHFWFHALKDAAESGNAFICSGHDTQTPFEQIYRRKPDALKVLTVPWGHLVVYRHIQGNESGLIRAAAPAFELGVVMARPLEEDNIYFVLRPNTTKPVPVQDIRPLEIDELRLTEDQWQQRSIQFDANGRIIGIPPTNIPLPTLRNLLQRHDEKRFQASPTSEITEQQRCNLEEWTGRIRRGGTFTNQSRRQLAGRTLRSDIPAPVRLNDVEAMVVDSVQHSKDSAESVPLPDEPYTTNHPEVQAHKPLAKWFVGEESGVMELFEGTLMYYLPKAPGRPRDMFRIKYADGDEDDVTKGELLRQQQLAVRVAAERKHQQQRSNNLHRKSTNNQSQHVVPSSDEETDPIYWSAAQATANVSGPHCNSVGHTIPVASNASTRGASEADILPGVQCPITSVTYTASSHQSIPEQSFHQPSSALPLSLNANVARAFIQTYEGAPTSRDAAMIQHLNTKSTVTTEDIKSSYNQSSVWNDEYDRSDAVSAFRTAFGRRPTFAEEQWCKYVSDILESIPTATQLQEAAKGPSNLQQLIRQLNPAKTSIAFAAVTTYNEANPSRRMAKESPDDSWRVLAVKWYNNSINSKELSYMTIEEAKLKDIKLVRHLDLFKTKPDRTRKFRHTPDEQPTAEQRDALGNLFAGGIANEAMKAQTAHAAYFHLKVTSADHINAYPGHNQWNDPANTRTQRVGTIMEAWETGLDHDSVAVYETVTNGFVDAPKIWSKIHTRSIIKAGLQRSACYKDLWFKFEFPGMLTCGVFIDDSLKTYTRNDEGEALHDMLMKQFNDDGLPMTQHDLDTSPEGINFLATHITKFSNDQGSGLAISQPIQVAKVAECLLEMNIDPTIKVYSPLLKGWSAAESNQLRHTVSAHNTFRFLRLLGGVSYQMSTGLCHPMVSLVAQQSAHATVLDTQAVVQIAQFHQTIGHIPITLYNNPEATDIRKPMPFHVDTDAGVCNATDGHGQCGIILRPGHRGNPSGAFHAKTKNVEHSVSTPGDEAWALAQSVGYIHTFRWLFEELAGLHPDPYNAAFASNIPPTALTVREDTGHDILSGDVGLNGCQAHAMADKWFRKGLHPVEHPPTPIHQDSLVVQEIVEKLHDTDKLKNLRSVLRFFRQIFEAIKDGLIAVFPQASPCNAANPLTKTPAGPLSLSRQMRGVQGYSTQWHEYSEAMEKRFGRPSITNNNNNNNNSNSPGINNLDDGEQSPVGADCALTPVGVKLKSSAPHREVNSRLHALSASNASTCGASETDIPPGVQFPVTSTTHTSSLHQSIPEQTYHQPSSSPLHTVAKVHGERIGTVVTATANAAWIKSTNQGSLQCMYRYGFSEQIQSITADNNPTFNVFRPGSKAPPNKLGIGFKPTIPTSQPTRIIRAHTAVAQTAYEKAYANLHLPNPETSVRADKALVNAHTTSNANPAFRRRMLSIIQEGHMDDITLWHINNKEELARHDLIQHKLRQQQTQRAAITSQSLPTPWQLSQPRRSAEERKIHTPHFFQSISDSGTSVHDQKVLAKTPVVSFENTHVVLPPLASAQASTNPPIAICYPQEQPATALSRAQKRKLHHHIRKSKSTDI